MDSGVGKPVEFGEALAFAFLRLLGAQSGHSFLHTLPHLAPHQHWQEQLLGLIAAPEDTVVESSAGLLGALEDGLEIILRLNGLADKSRPKLAGFLNRDGPILIAGSVYSPPNCCLEPTRTLLPFVVPRRAKPIKCLPEPV